MAQEIKAISITDEDVDQVLGIEPKKNFCKVLLSGIEYRSSFNKKTKLPYNSIDFVFVEKDTGYVNSVNFIEPKPNSKLRTEAEQLNVKRKLIQLKHIVTSYTNLDVLFNLVWDDTEDFEQLYARILATIVPNYKEIQTVIKLVYSNDNRNVQIPLFPNFISTALKPREIRITGNDRFEITNNVPKDEGQSGGGGTNSTGAGGEVSIW